MMLFPRPACPDGFEAAVSGARARVRDAVEAGSDPDFAPEWGSFKEFIAAGTNGRCCYCDTSVEADRFDGDVEHYRPKGRLDRLAITASGQRRKTLLRKPGTWWLAYDWSNYILACNKCNSCNKMNFFPVADEATRPDPLTEGCESSEVPLL